MVSRCADSRQRSEKVGQAKTHKGKARQKRKKTALGNKQAREATADLIDHRLRKALSHELRVQSSRLRISARSAQASFPRSSTFPSPMSPTTSASCSSTTA